MKQTTKYIIVFFLILIAGFLIFKLCTDKNVCVYEFIEKPVRQGNGDVIWEREILNDEPICHNVFEMFKMQKEYDRRMLERASPNVDIPIDYSSISTGFDPSDGSSSS